MTNQEFFIKCWRQEYPTFVRVFRAVPADKLDYRPDPVTRSAAELIWLQVQEKQCWFELLETGKIDWKPTAGTLSLDEMIRIYEKAHTELAPALQRVDDHTWNEKLTQFVMDGRVYFEVPLGENVLARTIRRHPSPRPAFRIPPADGRARTLHLRTLSGRSGHVVNDSAHLPSITVS